MAILSARCRAILLRAGYPSSTFQAVSASLCSYPLVAGMLGAALAFMFRVIMLLARMIANLVASGPLIGVMEDLAALMLFFMALLMAWLALLVMG